MEFVCNQSSACPAGMMGQYWGGPCVHLSPSTAAMPIESNCAQLGRENGFHTHCTFPLESSTIAWSPRISTSGSVYPVQHSVGYSEHGTKWNSRAAGCVTTVSLFTNDNESKVNRLSSWC
jgi:hypothetical protein